MVFLHRLHPERLPRILPEPQLCKPLESYTEPADLRDKFANAFEIRNGSAWIQKAVHEVADKADQGRSWQGGS